MKFDFEKHSPQPVESSVAEVELTEEEKQERFETECMVEADKLGVTLEELKKDIDALGGVEEFKKYFEESTGDGGNIAGAESKQLSKEIKSLKEKLLPALEVAALLAAYAVFLNMIDTNNNNVSIDYNGIQDAIQNLKTGTANAGHVIQGTMTALTGSLSAGVGLAGLKSRFEARKLEHQKKTNDLKFKMTGTDVV